MTEAQNEKSMSAYDIYIRDVNKIPLLTPEEEYELAIKVSQGDETAKHDLCQHNLKLVISIASTYHTSEAHMTLMDLIQEGNIGLLNAIDHFDYKKGYRFSTYATWWIRQKILRAISEQGSTIRLPSYLHDNITKMKKTIAMFEQDYGREPTLEEISEEIKIPTEKLIILIQHESAMLSLHLPIKKDEGDTTLEDIIEDIDAETPESIYMSKELSYLLNEILNMIPENEKYILECRYGLNGKEQQTLQQIGNTMHVSRERIRQIQRKAEQRIRTKSIKYGLKDYNPKRSATQK